MAAALADGDCQQEAASAAALATTLSSTRTMSFKSAYSKVSKYLTHAHSDPMAPHHETTAAEAGAVSAASPGKQRRGFSGRWLGLRKLSQVKGERAPASPQPIAEKPTLLKKMPSDKKIKIPFGGGEGPSGRGVNDGSFESVPPALDELEDEAADVELPPPMKPIQDPQAVLQQDLATPPAVDDDSTREQHGGVAGAVAVAAVAGEADEAAGPANPAEEVEEPANPGPSSAEAALRKRDFVLRELIETEEVYVEDLALVCEGYIAHMQNANADPPMPDSLRDRRHKMVFGNIEHIYDWHKNYFLRDLYGCLAKPEMLGALFRRFVEKRMFMYEAYCRNKPVSEYIVSENDHYFQELRLKLGHKLQLADLLIKPIQRIQKYHLLVHKIRGYTETGQCPQKIIDGVSEAVFYTSIIPKRANDMMDVGRLQGFTGNITAQGKLLLQEVLLCADVSSGGSSEKVKELHVFLFEQCIIFSEAVGRKTQFSNPAFNYKAHIQVNKMELQKLENGKFIISSYDKSKPKVSFLCRVSEERRQQWLATLGNILQSQKIFGEALENPGAYLRELSRDSAVGGLRKTESVPPSVGGRLAAEMRGRAQRPHAKANTINLPTTTIKHDDGNKVGAAVAANNTSATPPPHVNDISKRLWKVKLSRGGSGEASGSGGEGAVTERRAPELLESVGDVAAHEGRAAVLQCRLLAPRDAAVCWRRVDGPEPAAVAPGPRHHLHLAPDGRATLTIYQCTPADAGLYCCLVTHELGGVQSSGRLTVADANSAADAGAEDEEGAWQREQFQRRYRVEEELGRGRWARVMLARDTGTGQRVALKQAWSGAAGAREYRTLCRLAHAGVVRALALFASVPRAAACTLVLELAAGGPLLEWASAAPTQRYTQRNVAQHAKHLLQALNYLRLNQIAHLDVRPENILVEVNGNTAQLKLVDFGSAVDTSSPSTNDAEAHGSETSGGGEVLPPAPAHLEFSSPECVLGRPASPAWDLWAAGVFIYVFLTGLSPFLDESVEETTANIIKCDYCFPGEHWSQVDARAQDVVRRLLDADGDRRLAAADALLDDPWLHHAPANPLPVEQLKTFLERRRPAGVALLSPQSAADTT